MPTQCNQEFLEFHPLDKREVRGGFEDGTITSDAGGLLLREVEKRTGIIAAVCGLFPRSSARRSASSTGWRSWWRSGCTGWRESRMAILSRLLWALLLHPAVHLLWGTPVVCAAAPSEYRWGGGKRGGTRPPGTADSAGVARGADHRARRFGFLPGRADGVVRGEPGGLRVGVGQE